MVRVRTMFFMILSHRLLQMLSDVSALGDSRWLSSILTSTCFCILLALNAGEKDGELKSLECTFGPRGGWRVSAGEGG